MGYVFSSGSWPCVNPKLYHSQPFSAAATFDPFYFWGVFFPTLTILPSNLITLVPTLPYWPRYIIDLRLGSNYQPLTYLPSIFPWLNLYVLAKFLPFDITSNSSWINLHLFMIKCLHVDKKIISFWLNVYFLAKPLLLNKTYIFSWLNLYLLEKILTFLS